MILEKIPEHPMTAQQVLDHVARHLLVDQGAKSQITAGSSAVCSYRSDIIINGVKVRLACAVGCLVTEERYHEKLEGACFFSDQKFTPKFESALEGVVSNTDILAVPVLANLQRIHDRQHPENWFISIRELASMYDLNLDIKFSELHPWCTEH